jgi:S1-C subfamily serine protease
LWKTTVSGVVATCCIAACTGIVFAALAFTHGGAEISYQGLSITLPARTVADAPPPAVPAPPTVRVWDVAPPALTTPVAQSATPWLGIWYRETSVALPGESGAGEVCGARVLSVYSNSPAEQGSLHAGDVILAVDDRPLQNGLDLRNTVRSARVGAIVTLHVYRDDRLQRIPVTLGALPFVEE